MKKRLVLIVTIGIFAALIGFTVRNVKADNAAYKAYHSAMSELTDTLREAVHKAPAFEDRISHMKTNEDAVGSCIYFSDVHLYGEYIFDMETISRFLEVKFEPIDDCVYKLTGGKEEMEIDFANHTVKVGGKPAEIRPVKNRTDGTFRIYMSNHDDILTTADFANTIFYEMGENFAS